MTLSVPLPPEAEQALRERAAAAGKDLAVVASEVLTQALTALSHQRLVELGGDTHKRFVATGMTDQQLGEELEAVKHAARVARRGGSLGE